jgi:hypothetical protein
MADEPIPAKDGEKAAKVDPRSKGWGNLRPAKPGEVRNKTGYNGHRARQELVASILEEPDDDDPAQSRIRVVVLKLVALAKRGDSGGCKSLIEFYQGKARQQVELSGEVSGGVMLVPVAGNVEDWESAAQAAQQRLKEDVRT